MDADSDASCRPTESPTPAPTFVVIAKYLVTDGDVIAKSLGTDEDIAPAPTPPPTALVVIVQWSDAGTFIFIFGLTSLIVTIGTIWYCYAARDSRAPKSSKEMELKAQSAADSV
jgi:hypothetical protein